MKGLYKFYEDCYYGELLGFFIADSEKIKELMGKVVTFVECVGKHSEEEVEIDETNITLISEDPNFIEAAEKVGIVCGYNPLDWYNEQND